MVRYKLSRSMCTLLVCIFPVLGVSEIVEGPDENTTWFYDIQGSDIDCDAKVVKNSDTKNKEYSVDIIHNNDDIITTNTYNVNGNQVKETLGDNKEGYVSFVDGIHTTNLDSAQCFVCTSDEYSFKKKLRIGADGMLFVGALSQVVSNKTKRKVR